MTRIKDSYLSMKGVKMAFSYFSWMANSKKSNTLAKNNNMKNVILKYGLIAGGIVAFMLTVNIAEVVPFKYGEVIGYTSMLLAFSMIFFAIKNYRENTLNGVIGFGKAFKIGILITLIASAIYVMTWMVLSETIGQDFMEKYMEYAVANMKESGMSQADIDIKVEGMEKIQEIYKNPIAKMGITFLEIFPVGLLVSLVAAFVLKRKG